MDSWSCSLQELLQDEKMKEPVIGLNTDSSRVQPTSFSLAVHSFSDKVLEEGRVEVELVEAEYIGPNCVVFSYFEGDAVSQIERHFSRSLSHLCKPAPVQKETINNNGGQGKPMCERNLPKSFWNPTAKSSPRHVQFEHAQSLLAPQYQQHNPRAFFNHVRCGSSDAPDTSYGLNRICPPQWQQANNYNDYAVQRRYASNPGLNFSCYRMPGPVRFTNGSFAGYMGPRSEMMSGATCFYGPRIGYGFNPRYNSLLVHPEVKPQLPRIPGEPRSS